MNWEYQIICPMYSSYEESVLNEYGTRGWELVSVVPNNTGNRTFYFKRHLKEVKND